MSSIFFIFYQKKAVQKLWKMGFISSRKLFLFLRYSIFCCFFPFLSIVSRFKGSNHKKDFSKHVLQLKERLVTSYKHFLFFIILSIKRDWVQRKKSINFFMVSFKISYFQKSLTCIGCLGYLPKLKRVMGIDFSADFLHTLSIKVILIKYHTKRPSFNIWGEWPSGWRHYN